MKKAKDRNCQQLVVEVPIKTYKEIKIMAIKRNITLKTWILRALSEYLLKKEQSFEE